VAEEPRGECEVNGNVSNDEKLGINAYQDYLQYISEIVSKYEIGCEDKYKAIRADLSMLFQKIEDENLYLGVIGSFSSGKSTFINSVIHKNLLPTEAVQGTTVATSILKKSDRDDVEIVFNDGTTVRFSDDQKGMLERYQIAKTMSATDKAIEKSFWDKFIIWIKKLFGLYEAQTELRKTDDVESCMELFKKLISTEELASDIKYVTLFYNNANIPNRIAMVDTPGTESLNKRHNEVTKNAIDNVCDAIVVIIPYDEPVSEELLNYVNTNLSEKKDNCIFVVTKIELLGDLDELPQLIRVIKRRLENGLSIENAQVIPMPTLIYLKNVDTEMTTTFLDNITDDEKNNFIQMYENGIDEISNTLEKKRNEYIQRMIISICERVADKINNNLLEVANDYGIKEKKLREELVKPVNEFEQMSKGCIDKQYKSANQQLNECLSVVQLKYSHLSSAIEQAISGCVSSQDLILNLDFSCRDALKEINVELANNVRTAKQKFNNQLKQSQKEFNEAYSKCDVSARCSMITSNDDFIIEETFIAECENSLKRELDSLKIAIRSDTDGLLNKFKAFFSNPINKHKEMVLSRLLNLIENISRETREYASERLQNINSEYKQATSSNLEKMISENSYAIRCYMDNAQNAIETNSKGRKETEEDIKKLNKYICKLKGAEL
jgi:GTPase Era involved in 16S rRNA processing